VRYLAGCDGAHSRVRDALSIGFTGSTYPHVFYVADVEATGPQINYELHVALDVADFLAVFPLKSEGHARVIGTVKWELETAPKSLMWSDVSKDVINRLGLEVAKVNWFSTYRVHHRVAEEFRRGRAFLVGDAAHIHSPVGAQGMNTGIADAINLAWKLGAVIQDRAHESILDTYQPERIAFARRLVATIDRVFTAVTSPGSLARLIRTLIVPAILPTLTTFRFVRHFMFLTISQIGLSYRKSGLSEGSAGAIHGGDRLPWLADHSGDNFKSLLTDWQLHVFGEASDGLRGLCERRRLPLYSFIFSAEAKRAGFKVANCYLVRPDGYIGLVAPLSGLDSLERYLDRHRLRAIGVTGSD
jgi:hypothetical protein